MLPCETQVQLNLKLSLYSPGQTDPPGSRRLKLPEFLDRRHMKVKRLLALSTGRLYPSEDITGSLVLQAESTPGQ